MSKRFGRRRRRDMRSKIVDLEKKCANLKRSNDAFIKEHQIILASIDMSLSSQQANELRMCVMDLSIKGNLE